MPLWRDIKQMYMLERIHADFPGTRNEPVLITGFPTRHYNCFAWAYGKVTNRWLGAWPMWWPEDNNQPYNFRTSEFIRGWMNLGFEEVSDARYRQGYRTIALYEAHGEIQHAAVALSNGKWSSKLGGRERITHVSLESLEGDAYGYVYALMRSKI